MKRFAPLAVLALFLCAPTQPRAQSAQTAANAAATPALPVNIPAVTPMSLDLSHQKAGIPTLSPVPEIPATNLLSPLFGSDTGLLGTHRENAAYSDQDSAERRRSRDLGEDERTLAGTQSRAQPAPVEEKAADAADMQAAKDEADPKNIRDALRRNASHRAVILAHKIAKALSPDRAAEELPVDGRFAHPAPLRMPLTFRPNTAHGTIADSITFLRNRHHPVRWLNALLKSPVGIVIGFLLIIIGIIMIPLPGPGSPIVILGLSILARSFPWARHAKNGLRSFWRHSILRTISPPFIQKWIDSLFSAAAF
ncbi:MAG: PGPGW domain-containing protein [Elusimicrobiota bacterium]|jgi:hypothetical protein